MILTIDASAAVKLVLDEDHSPLARRAWDAASDVIAPTIVSPEVASAISAASQDGRIGDADTTRAHARWRTLVDSIGRRVVDEDLAESARQLAAQTSCRGMDAIYLAVAREVHHPDGQSALLSFDRRQRATGEQLGLNLVPATA